MSEKPLLGWHVKSDGGQPCNNTECTLWHRPDPPDMRNDTIREALGEGFAGLVEGAARNPGSDVKRSWVIDVCRTCDRHAVPPFCEHRTNDRWCYPVVVYTTAKRQKDSTEEPHG